MSTHFPQQWFLQLDGKRMGPFSPEQVLGLLADGEIPEGLTVYPIDGSGTEDRSSGMTAAEMREAYFVDDRIPTADGANPVATEPSREWDSSPSIPIAREEHDREAATNLATARRLFDLFQSARERRAKFLPPPAEDLGKLENHNSSVISWMRHPIAAAVAASVIVVAGVRFMGTRTSSDDTQRELAQSKSEPAEASVSQRLAPPPVRPAAPPHPVAKIQNTWRPAPRTDTTQTTSAGRPFIRPGVPSKPLRAPMPQTPAPEQNWAETRDAPPANEARAPEPDPNQTNQPNNVAADAGLAPGQMPPEQAFNDPNAPNPEAPPQPPEQPQDSYRVE